MTVVQVDEKEVSEEKYTLISALLAVKRVLRTSSDRVDGEEIWVHYKIYARGKGFVGPAQPKVLDHGGAYTVFLNLNEEGKYYTPAVRGQSFVKIDPKDECY